MSPSANSPTEVANTGYSAANFASIFAVLTTFNEVIRSNIKEPEELHAAVLCTEGSQKLSDLALALLAAASCRKTRTPLSAGHWPKLCSELAGNTVFILKGLQVPETVADSLDSFIEQPAAVHVDVLYWLCEAALMDNPAIKELVDREANKMRRPTLASTATQELVRLEPFAEVSKQRYWMFGDKTRQLYLESVSQRARGKLELLAQTPEEFTSLAQSLETERNAVLKELGQVLTDEADATVSKRRTFRKFTFRGVDLENLLDVPSEEFMQMVTCRARRKFKRGLKRKPMGLIKKLRLAKQNAPELEKPECVKTHLRNMIIVPEMIGSVVGIYNGKTFNQVEIKPDMIGHYLGEFSITYKPVRHGRPGIGATHSSRFIPLK
ncbi:40s ribosomal protein S15 [Coemansia sp. RSA 2336]|nr:40s ribosomal protein S15 [Coemansia sp. RSA 2336]